MPKTKQKKKRITFVFILILKLKFILSKQFHLFHILLSLASLCCQLYLLAFKLALEIQNLCSQNSDCLEEKKNDKLQAMEEKMK